MSDPFRSDLLARLGLDPRSRALIVNVDDLGMHPATVDGFLQAMDSGLATSGSLMTPAPAAPEAARRAGSRDVGVHLTVNCEWHSFRWSPLTDSPSLRGSGGDFLFDVRDSLTADPDDVERELRAQVEQALAWGVDVTHLDSHMYVLHDHDRWFDLYLRLAVEHRLPVRLSGSASRPDERRRRAASAGVVAPDHLVPLGSMGSREWFTRALLELSAGVTEFHAHPVIDGAEVRDALPDWSARVDDLALLCDDPEFHAQVRESGAVLLGYRELRDLMR